MTRDASWHALDFLAGVLGADPVGRDRALEELLRDPREGFYAVSIVLLLVATPEARDQVAHMLAMTSLSELGSP